MRSRG